MTQDARDYLIYQRHLDRMINTGCHVYPDEIAAALVKSGLVGSVLARGEARFANYTVIPDNLVIDRATGRHHFLDAKTTPRTAFDDLRPIVPAGGTAPLRDIPVTSPRYPAAIPGQAADPRRPIAQGRLKLGGV